MLFEKGYLYAATNQRYIDEAIRSVRSLRKINQNIHATLVTDKDVQIIDFNSTIKLNYSGSTDWKSGLLFKILALQNSPYDKTFFLDTDTFFCDECDELFDLLEYHDLLIAHSPGDVSQISINDKLLDGYFPYNTGVIIYQRNQVTKKLLQDWYSEYATNEGHFPDDQAAFMKVLLHNNVNVYVLQSIYNFRSMFFVSLPEKNVKIIHGRLNDYNPIKERVNSKNIQRAWDPAHQKIHFRKKTNALKLRIFNSTPNSILKIYDDIKLFIKGRKRF